MSDEQETVYVQEPGPGQTVHVPVSYDEEGRATIPRIMVIGGGGGGGIGVVNAGTATNPNFFGSAEEMGRLRGLRDALEAVRNCDPKMDTSYPYEQGRNDSYEACVDAVKALLPPGVEW